MLYGKYKILTDKVRLNGSRIGKEATGVVVDIDRIVIIFPKAWTMIVITWIYNNRNRRR